MKGLREDPRTWIIERPWICCFLVCVKKKNFQTICIHPPALNPPSITSKLWSEVYFPVCPRVFVRHSLTCLPPLFFSLPLLLYRTSIRGKLLGKQTDISVCCAVPEVESSQRLFIRTQIFYTDKRTTNNMCPQPNFGWERKKMQIRPAGEATK